MDKSPAERLHEYLDANGIDGIDGFDRAMLVHLQEEAAAGYRRTAEAVALENVRLRAVLHAHHINPDLCGVFVRGGHCVLPAGHDGGHKWAGGD